MAFVEWIGRMGALLFALVTAGLVAWFLMLGAPLFSYLLVPLVFAALTIFGAAGRNTRLMWVGAIGAAAFGALAVAGVGTQFLFLGLGCLISTALFSWGASQRRARVDSRAISADAE
jgi:hypothetical protein